MSGSLYKFDLNAYCTGHITGHCIHENIISFPENFVTEAAALGAVINKTVNGFETARYLFNDPDELYYIPFLADTKPAYRVMEEIRRVSNSKIILLKVNGPYSILASLIDPKLLYRWLVRNSPAVHAALNTITMGLAEYINRAVAEGVKIISLADPYANPEILGEKRYRELTAAYLLGMLKTITAKLNASVKEKSVLLHICPHNSVPLVQFGYMETRDISITHGSYIDALTEESLFPPGLTIAGNQCIYSENTKTITILSPL
jgi:uroporphyrinogen-III decarboxylase